MKAFASKMYRLIANNRRGATSEAASLHTQSGQALIEMAFILPILLILALGVIEIGRYAYIAILVGNAARAGAAYGAQNKQLANDSTGIQNAAQYDFAGSTSSNNSPPPPTNGLAATTLLVASTNACGCDSAGSVVTVGCNTAAGNADPGTCPAGSRWIVFVSVTASGNYNSLFNYPGIPSSISISRTALLPVP
jgi:Flp pilus assembly protein TadG